jgi:hypothetical protein
LNWAGVGARAPPPGAIGLRHFVVRLPTKPRDRRSRIVRAANIPFETRDDGLLVRDPAGNAILLTA